MLPFPAPSWSAYSTRAHRQAWVDQVLTVYMSAAGVPSEAVCQLLQRFVDGEFSRAQLLEELDCRPVATSSKEAPAVGGAFS